jgi:hypothetical protein
VRVWATMSVLCFFKKKSRYLENCSKSVPDPLWSVGWSRNTSILVSLDTCNVSIWSMCTKIITKITRSNLDVSIVQIKHWGLWFRPFLLVFVWWSWLSLLKNSMHLVTFTHSLILLPIIMLSVWFSSFINDAINNKEKEIQPCKSVKAGFRFLAM